MQTREYTRYATGAPCSFKIDGMMGEQHLYLKDASQGGFCFNTLACIKSGTHLKIKVPFTDNAENAHATVQWCQSLGKYQCLLGLSFDTLIEQSAIDRISRFHH